VDVSSDVRFVVQLTALCPVLWVEYRPVDLGLERLETRQGDVTALPFRERSIPSLSCMHVVEHVGLGRYGDPLAPDGHERACGELARVLAPGGALFLSMPVGRPRVCFNAHRVLDPASVPGLVPELRLVEFSVVTTAGRFRELVRPEDYRGEDYACGLYWLARP
jgi:predicted SAM-dependent methyltransferase